MYIFITPKGQVTKSDKVTMGDYKRADNGQYQIISFAGNNPVQYIKGDWYGINNHVFK